MGPVSFESALDVVEGLRAAPCIGSGYCCSKALCHVGLAVHGDRPGPCPSLVFRDGRHWCGVILEAEREDPKSAAEIKTGLGVGRGCCSPLNSWRREPLKDRTVKGVGDE